MNLSVVTRTHRTFISLTFRLLLVLFPFGSQAFKAVGQNYTLGYIYVCLSSDDVMKVDDDDIRREKESLPLCLCPSTNPPPLFPIATLTETNEKKDSRAGRRDCNDDDDDIIVGTRAAERPTENKK